MYKELQKSLTAERVVRMFQSLLYRVKPTEYIYRFPPVLLCLSFLSFHSFLSFFFLHIKKSGCENYLSHQFTDLYVNTCIWKKNKEMCADTYIYRYLK